MKLKIGTKITLGFSIVLLLLAALGVNATLSIKYMNADINSLNVVNNRLSLQRDLESSFAVAVGEIRGFIAYGNNTYSDSLTKNMDHIMSLENQLLEVTPEDKKPEVQKLIEITGSYFSAMKSELMPAIVKMYEITDYAAMQTQRGEVVRIAGTLTPITEEISEILSGLVSSDKKIFSDSIKSTTDNGANIIRTSIILVVTALIIGVIISFFITRSIKNPILKMVSGANLFAQGDFTSKIEVASRDEVGELADSLNTMSGRLRELIADVVMNAQTIAAHSEELAASAEEVSATVEEVAGTTCEVAATAEKSMENANATADESRKVVEAAEAGGKTIKQTIEKIDSISNSTETVNQSIQNLGDLSEKIGNITDVITGIADQTNLLALNAAIEAARAGEHGRGFAVVAEEVRKLAEQSANAAKEIGLLITKIKSGVESAIRSMEQSSVEVGEGVKLASGAGAALENIIKAINRNIVLIEEITIGVQQSSEGTQQLSANNEQVSTTIQEVAGSTQELAGIASKLQTAVAQFKV